MNQFSAGDQLVSKVRPLGSWHRALLSISGLIP
jgi:hypothetical protein